MNTTMWSTLSRRADAKSAGAAAAAGPVGGRRGSNAAVRAPPPSTFSTDRRVHVPSFPIDAACHLAGATTVPRMSLSAPEYVEGHGLLAGRAVLITAAAGSGIGFAAAKRCIEEGARVVISDWHERRLGEAAEELGVHGIVCDVTNEQHVQALFDGALDVLGGLDVLINNAGLGGTAEVVSMTDEQWSRVIDVTLTGTFRCTRTALKHMQEQGHGVM